MKTRLILFVTDRGFIVPTLVAARQILAQTLVTRIADIMVALVGFTASELAGLEEAFPNSQLHFVPLAIERLPPAVAVDPFKTSHVNLTAIARLLTPRLIPPRYQHIVYLDGDVQVVGDLLPLVAYDVPEGRLLAANDRLSFSRFRFGELGLFWRDTQRYMGSLGVEDEMEYFNSGVLAARREAWSELCGKAARFFEENPALCRFHDQSALVAVSRGKREVLSPLYNFATGLAELISFEEVRPSIVHFTGARKPWLFNDAPPWGGNFSQVYEDLLTAFPVLRVYAQDWPRLRAQRARQRHRSAITVKAMIADAAYRRQNRARLRENLARAVPLSAESEA